MKLALAQRFKHLLLALPPVALLAAVLFVTHRGGWIALAAFIATLWVVLSLLKNLQQYTQ